MTQSICITCKVRSGQGRLRPRATEVHRPWLWREGSAVPGLPAGAGAAAQHFREKREMNQGKMMAKGAPLLPPPPQAAWHPQASLELEGQWPCCPSSLAGPAADCMNAVVPGVP